MAYGVDKTCEMEGKYKTHEYGTIRTLCFQWNKENPQDADCHWPKMNGYEGQYYFSRFEQYELVHMY